jgi:hypothetical protein
MTSRFARRSTWAAVAALSVPLWTASAALADDIGNGTGGASPDSERPIVRSARCGSGTASACRPGQVMALRGRHLDGVDTVLFPRRASRRHLRIAPRRHTAHRVLVRVPRRARSGRVRAASASSGAVSRAVWVRLAVTEPAPVPAQPAAEGVFPVRGAHDFGTYVNRFGGGRSHQGQDILAGCGIPIVASLSGTVTEVKWQSAAGNYAVVTAADGTSQVYMHMLQPASVRRGARVAAGSRIGLVGQTGRASACHLHFELWTAPGWYAGGHAIDPLPALRRWDASG